MYPAYYKGVYDSLMTLSPVALEWAGNTNPGVLFLNQLTAGRFI